MLPEGEQEKFQDEMFDTILPPGDDADMVGSILYINELIAKRQKKYFPDLKKLIIENGSICQGTKLRGFIAVTDND